MKNQHTSLARVLNQAKCKHQYIIMKNTLITLLLLCFNLVAFTQYNSIYQSGEVLNYEMYYGWINGGNAALQLSDTIINDKIIHHSKMHAKTAGLTDKLYKVSDVYESYFDQGSGLPLLAIRNIKEGGYKYYNEVTFNNDSNEVTSQKSGVVAVPDSTFDILSSIYYLRKLVNETGLVDGQIINLSTYFGDEHFPLILRYKGTERVKTDLGKINCHKFSPIVEVGRVFETQDDMTIWFSGDKNFVPIRVQFELFIGSLKCDLISYEGLAHQLEFQ